MKNNKMNTRLVANLKFKKNKIAMTSKFLSYPFQSFLFLSGLLVKLIDKCVVMYRRTNVKSTARVMDNERSFAEQLSIYNRSRY